ncbi:hypothetical protein Anas_14770, partial [Armadillidium nasatum]
RVAETIPDKRPSLYVESFHVGCLFKRTFKTFENSNLKETVTKMLTGKMMESSTEAFGKFSVSAPRNGNAERKSNINSKKDHLNEHCSDSYMGSTESNDSD